MIKYWVDYVTNRGSNKAGYRTLEGFITDVVDWVQSEHEDPEEQLYIYEEHHENDGFYITLDDIKQDS